MSARLDVNRESLIVDRQSVNRVRSTEQPSSVESMLRDSTFHDLTIPDSAIPD
jgi:hypothetical protein